jgi:predicted amidohydrolase YtcJ
VQVAFTACSTKTKVDLIVHNAVVYTVDSSFSIAQAVAIKEGKFVAIGTDETILQKYNANEIIDVKGKAMYPGFIDAHCHFYGYGKGLSEVNLVATNSFDEVLERLIAFKQERKNDTAWLIGRGWDQNDWETKTFPNNKKLDSIFPNTPVFLQRIDGHAALINSAALRKLNLILSNNIKGGVVEIINNRFTGILIDNAVEVVQSKIPKLSDEEIKRALLDAQKNCFAVGLTTVDDAGLEKNIVDAIDKYQKSKELKMRVYAMLTDNKENLNYYLNNGVYKTERLNVSSFKCYADGALGSRGACLSSPYSDKPKEKGFLLNTAFYYDSIAHLCYAKGFQMNTHCIGDSAVKLISEIYSNLLIDNAADSKRWRIEHLQVASPNILALLKNKLIIPSVQPTHATSDMYWATERLGNERIKYAYSYNDLLKATGIVALGTDFPVENINPLYTFYAAVVRKDLKGFPANGFQMENALSRVDALKGMTSWAAYSNFEEKEKGSIEIGKFADFVILDKDIMKCKNEEILHSKVVSTYINGERVY